MTDLQPAYPETTDIRELMARRLKAIFASKNFNEPQPFLEMADEVLRQMTWARREIGDRHFGAHRDDREYLDTQTPLTIAPDDWRPE